MRARRKGQSEGTAEFRLYALPGSEAGRPEPPSCAPEAHKLRAMEPKGRLPAEAEGHSVLCPYTKTGRREALSDCRAHPPVRRLAHQNLRRIR